MSHVVLKGIINLSLLLFATTSDAKTTLKFDTQFILEAVLEKMGHSFDPQKPIPKVFFGSEVDIEQFQNDIEPQWGIRPHVVLNVYIADLNVIYLLDDPQYYSKTKRFIEDSLAHELAHYVQVVYENTSLEHAGDHIELDAVNIQNWFRETYMKSSEGLDQHNTDLIY